MTRIGLLLPSLLLGACAATNPATAPPVEVVELGGVPASPPPAAPAPAAPEAPAAPPAAEWVDAPLVPDTWASGSVPFNEGEYTIAIPAGESLERMFSMTKGDVIVYRWTADVPRPEQLAAEFHGHTIRLGSAPGTVMFYATHRDGHESGMLRAPFSGVHGWYLKNESSEDVVVRLSLAGFYAE